MAQAIVIEDMIPFRLELHVASFLLSIAVLGYGIFLVSKKTPRAMISYRSAVVDSLISNWIFSALTVFVCSVFFTNHDGNLYVYFLGVANYAFPSLPFHAVAFVYSLSIMNEVRSNLNCFKQRFETAVADSLEWYFHIRTPVIYISLLYSCAVLYYMSFNAISESDTNEILEVSAFGLAAAQFRPAKFGLSLAWLAPFAVLFAMTGVFFAGYAFGTYHFLRLKLRLAQARSKRLLAAQMHSFLMLLAQFVFTYLVALGAIGMAAVSALFPIPFFVGSRLFLTQTAPAKARTSSCSACSRTTSSSTRSSSSSRRSRTSSTRSGSCSTCCRSAACTKAAPSRSPRCTSRGRPTIASLSPGDAGCSNFNTSRTLGEQGASAHFYFEMTQTYSSFSLATKIDFVNTLMDRAGEELQAALKRLQIDEASSRFSPSTVQLVSGCRNQHLLRSEVACERDVAAPRPDATDSEVSSFRSDPPSGLTVGTSIEVPIRTRCRVDSIHSLPRRPSSPVSLVLPSEPSEFSTQSISYSVTRRFVPHKSSSSSTSKRSDGIRRSALTESECDFLKKMIAKKRRGTLTEHRRAELDAKN